MFALLVRTPNEFNILNTMIRVIEADCYRIGFSGFHRGEMVSKAETNLVFVSPTPHILHEIIGCVTLGFSSDRVG